jgi:hypothetical protein
MACGATESGWLYWNTRPVVSLALGTTSTHSSMSNPATGSAKSTGSG